MRKVLWIAMAVIFGCGANVQANSIACGEDYTVQAGETASGIASKAFGRGIRRQLFVNALIHRHGQTPPAGTVIAIPCASEDGLDLPKDYWSAANFQLADIMVHTAGYDHANIGSTRGAHALFDALLEGMLREGLLSASYKALSTQDYATYRPFPSSQGSYDVSFPWLKSDCAGQQEAWRRNGQLCTGVLWSDPLFEVTSSLYFEVGNDANLSTDLGGLSICVADESRSAVVQSGLLDADAFEVTSGSASRCLADLRSGAVAAAIVPDIVAASDMRKNSGAPALISAPGLAFSDMVHAVVDNKNPNARRILKRLNDGLAKTRDSGEWYDTVHAQLIRGLN